jgi:predicted MFS family arabinose efflux permease
VQGAGLGAVMAPLSSAVLAGLPAQHAGTGSGVLSTVQQVGNALGVALIGLVFYGVLPAADMTRAFSAALACLAASALLVAALHGWRRRLR